MSIADLTVDLRPRQGWEAADLGIRMVQCWAARIYPPIVLLVVGVTLPGLVLLPTSEVLWLAVVLWWAKPLYDRVVLGVLSRAVFGQRVAWMDTFALLRKPWRSGLLRGLTLARFDPARGFHLPVTQLEGLRGEHRRRRNAILRRRAGGYATMLTLVWLHLESLLTLALLGFVWFLIPADVGIDWPEVLAWLSMPVADYVLVVAYAVVMTLLEPIYVASSFALYLNRRAWLEGWDIELAFRRMSQRIERDRAGSGNVQIVGLVAIVAAGWWGSVLTCDVCAAQTTTVPWQTAGDVHAATVANATSSIATVLANPAFAQSAEVTRWVRNDPSEPPAFPEHSHLWQGIVEMAAMLLQGALWLMLIVGLMVLVVYWLRRKPSRASTKAGQAALPSAPGAGVTLTAGRLPEDIPAAALAAWREGSVREALSLLYRGSLIAASERYEVRVTMAATEGDVLTVAQSRLPTTIMDYLTRLTLVWQASAYAHRNPPQAEFVALCGDFGLWQRT